mgnify:CR=1 FL=1
MTAVTFFSFLPDRTTSAFLFSFFRTGILCSGTLYTGASVNIYALGVGAEKFRGVFDNTEIYHKLAELTGVQ